MRSKILILFMVIIISLFAAYLSDEQKSKGQKSENFFSLAPASRALLPDLKILPTDELYIISANGSKTLRFSSAFINQGEGPFEISGRKEPEDELVTAIQVITNTDGSVVEKEFGKFVFHPDHNHWHIADYTVFELWSYGENGQKEELLASTNKISFCIWDEKPYDLNLERAPKTGRYPWCSDNDIEKQGISVGWSDTYSAGTPGQELDITSIPDGDYLVRSEINPDKKILEKDYGNNESIDYIRISGNRVTRVSN
jgi:hypothetical protein